MLKLEPSMDCLGPAGACVALSAALYGVSRGMLEAGWRCLEIRLRRLFAEEEEDMTRVFDPISAVDGQDSEMLRRGRRRAESVDEDRQQICVDAGLRDKVLERVDKNVVRGSNAKAIYEFVKGLVLCLFLKKRVER